MDNRTDAEKQASPYFSHWEHTGPLKALKIGPRKAVYKPMTEAQAVVMAEAGESISAPVMVTRESPAAKAITFQEFSRLYDAGIGVRSAHKLVKHSPWALRCIEIKAKSLASIPWDLWAGDAPLDDSHPLKRLLLEVNPEMNWMDLMSATEADMNVFGMAFWLKLGTGPNLLQRLNPAAIDILADNNGIQGFRHTKSAKVYPRNKIVFFHSYDPENDFGGASPLESVRAPIEVEIAANNHLKEFFNNRAMPDYIMALPTNNTNEIKRLADQWKREFQGRGGQHKTGWVGGGATPHSVGYAPRDLALAEVREEARRQICAGFGVPPALVAAWEAANYATIREQRQSLYTEVLFPEARYFAGVMNAELIPPEVEFRWDFSKVDAMQDTEDAKTKRMVWMVDARIIKPEVAAEELGYEPEDVPEPLPQPDFGGDSSDNNNNVGRATTPTSAQSDNKTEAALRKWRRKVLNRLRDGKPALCDFESAYVSEMLNDAVKAQLEEVTTPDEAHQVFESAWLLQD